jgi:hypothetical protein
MVTGFFIGEEGVAGLRLVDGVDGFELGLAVFQVDIARAEFEAAMFAARTNIHCNKKVIRL